MHSRTSGPLAGQMRMAGAKITWEAASFMWLVPEPEGLEGSAGTVTWSTYTWQVRVTWLLTAEQPALTGCVSRESALSRRPRKKLQGSFGLTPEVTGSLQGVTCVAFCCYRQITKASADSRGGDWTGPLDGGVIGSRCRGTSGRVAIFANYSWMYLPWPRERNNPLPPALPLRGRESGGFFPYLQPCE